jgi:amino acid adenylation domain-containing protein
VELVVALLGILKAGGAYVPLDPNYPRERLVYMAQDAGLWLLVTHGVEVQELFGSHFPVMTVREVLAVSARTEAPEPSASPDNLAYVIYTSGSTGRPKGAMVPHRAIVNHMRWMLGTFPLGAEDAVVQKTPISFDASVWEFWAPLLSGARLVLAEPEGHRDAAYLSRLITRERVTVLQIVPSLLKALLDEPAFTECRSLKRVFCGGEALGRGEVARFRERLGAGLYNLYGPTEAAVDVSWWECGGDKPWQEVPIGRPVWNTRLYVLDEGMEPVPPGVAGELYIGGVQVGRGYLGSAEQTAQRFVPDPFSQEEGSRLYRTGDVARYRGDGAIEYLGRVDGQVKVRGFRIETGEVEAGLKRCAGVEEAVVVAREQGPGDTRLVAYVVGRGWREEGLRQQLKQQLPEYMVPWAYVGLERLPLTPSGKVDRRALPAPRPKAEREVKRARTPLEEVVAGVWQEVLGVGEVGVEEDFFELGGHSLLATQVVARVRQVLGLEVGVRAMFEAPTVEQLARRLEGMQRQRQALAVPPLVKQAQPSTGPHPLSYAQQRLWFLERLQPGNSAYHMAAGVWLEGPLRHEELRRALQQLVQRHEILRTSFHAEAEGPVQRVHEAVELELPVVEVAGQHREERRQQARQRAIEEARRPFQLESLPLLRAVLVKVGPEEHLLTVVLHHIIADGWSVAVVVRELGALYQAQVEGREAQLPELAVQYGDYARWQRQALVPVVQQQLEYWKQQLSGAPEVLALPTDKPRPAVQSYRGGRVAVQVPGVVAQALQALSRREGATLYMTLLASFQVLLARYASVKDVVVGTPVAGRTQANTESLVGLFVNTLVLRTQLSGAGSFREVLRRVKEVTLGAYAHQEVPFEKLVEVLQPRRDLSHAPLFQVMFALQNMPRQAPELAGLKLSPEPLEEGAAKFDLTLTLQQEAGGLEGSLEYNADLFEPATVERMVRHLSTLLAGVAADAEASVWTLPLMEPGERQQVVEQWNATAVAGAWEGTLHGLFEAQAVRSPEAVAVVCGDARLSYRELEQRANQMAWHLRAQGVGPEVRVGVCARRSVELVVALLGILKAGGAYVPLDPNYPRERLVYMAQDAGLRLLVTHGVEVQELFGSHFPVMTVREVLAASARTEAPEPSASPDTLAYVIYTSGSTGRPKGVAVTHRQLVHSTHARAVYYPEPVERFLMLSSFAFDSSVAGIFWTLVQGGALVLPEEGVQQDPQRLAEGMAREGITHLLCTPGLYGLLLAEHAERRQLDGLRTAIVAGEACPRELVERHHALLGRTVLYNEYGPTEATVWSTVHRCEVGEPRAHVSIGRPIPNVRVYLLDEALQPVPAGLPGELFVGGPGVARGYLERPELTAERFVPDPFSREPGARLYRTGDVARFLSDGAIDFLGRVDGQVKIRGFRIETGEVEAALRQHPAVREAVVMAREQGPGDKRLVAYVAGDGGLQAGTLRDFLRRTLPDPMVPSAFVLLAELPRNTHGKVDRQALPMPSPDRSALQTPYVPPESELEQTLGAVWCEVLRLERVGRDDNFFDLGGHSLAMVQVQRRLREALSRELSLVELFRYPTVRALAEHLARELGQASSAGGAPEARERQISEGRERMKQRLARRRHEG